MAAGAASLSGNIQLISITPEMGLSLALIGLVGGLLSGFLGLGGAFIMTPAMMSMGIPGIMALAGNMAHKFGKSVVGCKKYAEFGEVDKKLGLVMFVALFAGVRLAVTVNKRILDAAGMAASNLYISMVLIIVLTLVSVFMFRDFRGRRQHPAGSSGRAGMIKLGPLIFFPVAKIRVSLWLCLVVGVATGFLDGTIAVGGFIGIPAMVYLLGVSVPVAAGTQLFLDLISGMQGTFLYTVNGYVDLRIPLLLYLGSIVGVTLGAVATRVVKNSQIQLVMALVMAVIVCSRSLKVPVYLAEMGRLALSPGMASVLGTVSNMILFGSGLAGCSLIIYWMYRAWEGNRPVAAGGSGAGTRIGRIDSPARPGGVAGELRGNQEIEGDCQL